jgi:hypothetical protein
VKAKTVSVLLRADGERIAITMLVPGYKTEAHDTYIGVAFLMLDQALGEYDVETRVGQIEVQAPGAARKEAISLQDLPHAFDAFFARR